MAKKETAKPKVSRKSKHGEYSINTFQANLRLGRELHRKCEVRAKELGLDSFSDYLRRLAEQDTKNVKLAAEDYMEIARRIEHENELRRKRGL